MPCYSSLWLPEEYRKAFAANHSLEHHLHQILVYPFPAYFSLDPLQLEKDLLPFPMVPLDQLTEFVDAAYANDKRNRRSTTGYSFTFAGGVIACRSKTQSITATSFTEAEFFAAALTANAARFFSAVMSELGFCQSQPTPMYEDKEPTTKMVNARIPTGRSRHIDIQHFAILD
jgi:hypothetical protein